MKSYSIKRRILYFLLYSSGLSWLFLKFKKRKTTLHVYGHRVLNPDSKINKFFINSGHAISKNDFERKLKLLTSNFVSSNIKNFNNNSFIVSFDDGYIDNLKIALPVMEKYNTPVHIFLITNIVKNNVLFWPDILGCICANIKGKYKFEFSNNFYFFDSDQNKIDSYLEICKILKHKNNSEIEKLINNIIEIVQYRPEIEFNDFYISKDDISKYNKLVTYGAHSYNHENLCLLNDYELKNTINDSIEFVKQLTGIETVTFAYPYGEYNESIVKYFENYKPCKYSFTTKNIYRDSNYEKGRINLNLNPYYVFHIEISGVFKWLFNRRLD